MTNGLIDATVLQLTDRIVKVKLMQTFFLFTGIRGIGRNGKGFWLCSLVVTQDCAGNHD